MSDDRVAIVTGAAKGIGAAIASELAARGLAVALLDLDGAGVEKWAMDLRGRGFRAHPVKVDVTNSAQVDSAVTEVESTLGAPTVLVNNAGITKDNMLFKMSEQDWDAVINVHLKGSFLLTKSVQRHMVAAGYGRIVNISSSSALGNVGQANYATAKAGLQGFTKTLALELGKFGVTANCVAPGFIVSDMTRATAARLGQEWDAYLAARIRNIPVQRPGQPEDIAGLVGYLCSAAAGYVSGQVIYVAGGPKA